VAPPSRRLSRFLLIGAALVAALVLSRGIWLPAIGAALVTDEPNARADVAIVLGGDYKGDRVLRGGELVRQGRVRAAWVSGPNNFYGGHESDLAIGYAVRRGFPAGYFVAFPNDALSTADEAALFIAELGRREIRSFLLVTSDYHTARAARTFRAEIRRRRSPVEMHVVAVYDDKYNVRMWWQTREGQKMLFFESAKTIAAAVGL
jgi:uncharacterized SAM-binding protein YcdF (DUF218 family)